MEEEKEGGGGYTYMQLETAQVCFVQTNVCAAHAITQPQGAQAGTRFAEVLQGSVGEVDAIADGQDFEARTVGGELGQAEVGDAMEKG